MSGIILGESIADYHANPAFSSTQLCDMRPCPLGFYEKHIAKTVPRKKSDAFDFGTAAHALILEGVAAYDRAVVIRPEIYSGKESQKAGAPIIDKPWNANATICKDWMEENSGRIILTLSEHGIAFKMLASVGQNPTAFALLSGGRAEVTFRKTYQAYAVQARADYWHHDGVQLPGAFIQGAVCVDLKTCASIERFKSEYWKMRYCFRAAFYREVIRAALADLGCFAPEELRYPRFVFVAVEKQSPNRCEVFEPTESDLDLAHAEVMTDLKALRDCLASNVWPGSRAGIQLIELTAFQRKLSAENGMGIFQEDGAL